MDGLCSLTEEGAPQGAPKGGPQSPLVRKFSGRSFQKFLEERWLKFVKFSDKCNICRRSLQGSRESHGIVAQIPRREEQRLKVNRDKCHVGSPKRIKVLRFCFMENP
jgi:hypothetical protein